MSCLGLLNPERRTLNRSTQVLTNHVAKIPSVMYRNVTSCNNYKATDIVIQFEKIAMNLWTIFEFLNGQNPKMELV